MTCFILDYAKICFTRTFYAPCTYSAVNFRTCQTLLCYLHSATIVCYNQHTVSLAVCAQMSSAVCPGCLLLSAHCVLLGSMSSAVCTKCLLLSAPYPFCCLNPVSSVCTKSLLLSASSLTCGLHPIFLAVCTQSLVPSAVCTQPHKDKSQHVRQRRQCTLRSFFLRHYLISNFIYY